MGFWNGADSGFIDCGSVSFSGMDARILYILEPGKITASVIKILDQSQLSLGRGVWFQVWYAFPSIIMEGSARINLTRSDQRATFESITVMSSAAQIISEGQMTIGRNSTLCGSLIGRGSINAGGGLVTDRLDIRVQLFIVVCGPARQSSPAQPL